MWCCDFSAMPNPFERVEGGIVVPVESLGWGLVLGGGKAGSY